MDIPGFICETCGQWTQRWGVAFDHATGEILLGTSSGSLVIGRWSPKKWIKVRYVLDRAQKTVSVWIDGTQVAASKSLPTGATNVNQIGGFSVTSEWPAQEVFYDDIKVFTLP